MSKNSGSYTPVPPLKREGRGGEGGARKGSPPIHIPGSATGDE